MKLILPANLALWWHYSQCRCDTLATTDDNFSKLSCPKLVLFFFIQGECHIAECQKCLHSYLPFYKNNNSNKLKNLNTTNIERNKKRSLPRYYAIQFSIHNTQYNISNPLHQGGLDSFSNTKTTSSTKIHSCQSKDFGLAQNY